MHSYLEVAHHFGWCKERFYSMDTLFAKNFANIHVIFSCLEVTPNKVGPGSSAKPSNNKHWMRAVLIGTSMKPLGMQVLVEKHHSICLQPNLFPSPYCDHSVDLKVLLENLDLGISRSKHTQAFVVLLKDFVDELLMAWLLNDPGG